MVNIAELSRQYEDLFDASRPRICVQAPGRVNLIGEHTDYNDGFVLPIAMSQSLWILGGPADDGQIAVHSTAFGETVLFPAEDPGPPDEPAWSNYVRGVAAMLRNEGVPLEPCRLLIHSEVPIGGGVSSSAALEVGSAMALLAIASQRIDPVQLALLAQKAEHEYANSPCGIMDQFICVLGEAGHALLLDCRSREYRQVPIDASDTTLVVMNTQVKHSIGSSEYPVRQQQCRDGLAVLQRCEPRLQSLRDATVDLLDASRFEMEDVAFRRCRHVVTEIERTAKAADALADNDISRFGELMFDSHASLSNDYEVSCPELDALVEIARSVPGVYGARMTGGGFGGCAIALVRSEAEQQLREELESSYNGAFDRPAIVYTTDACDGASVQPI